MLAASSCPGSRRSGSVPGAPLHGRAAAVSERPDPVVALADEVPALGGEVAGDLQRVAATLNPGVLRRGEIGATFSCNNIDQSTSINQSVIALHQKQ